MAILTSRRWSNAALWIAPRVLCWAVMGQTPAPDLSQASLEDLMNIRVTSVSKKEQKLSQTGAAIFVITQEDIRRSGATNIPDVLRLAPGVDVARVDANRWAISIRGFNDQHANKLLVLIDGRSVYSPSFSGVFWDMQDVPLDDIDRIEVIRGPGGTVWGANAVNGVINIITKNSRATRGGLISAGAGSEDRADGLAQYGGDIGQAGSYRIFARYFDVGDSVLPGGQQADDGWQSGHAGFRSDWDLSPSDRLTVQGDFLQTGGGQTLTTLVSNALPKTETFSDVVSATAGNALGRWTRTLANGSEISLQLYEDYSRHLEQGFSDAQNTDDLDFQQHLSLGSWNDVVWGLGARVTEDDYGSGFALTILPSHQMEHRFTGFVQDELTLNGAWSLTLGSKVEHNNFSGFEYEPSARIVWAPSSRQAVWTSIARAIRQPGSSDEGLRVDAATVPLGPTFGLIQLLGNVDLRAEELRDVEAGYRTEVNNRISLDVAAFAGLYRNLESAVPQAPYFASQLGVPYLVLPELLENAASALSYGAEFSGNWNVKHGWRLSPGYSFLHINATGDVSGLVLSPGSAPSHQFQVRSLLDLPHRFEWDNTVGYVGKLGAGNIPAYARGDSRLGWRAGEFVDLSLVGQNLLSPRHAEFFDSYGVIHTLVERSVFGRITWRF
jgi:iron complex outermembrane recepter protein